MSEMQHPSALSRKFDGVDDSFMKRAVDAASSNGEFKYLPAQLDYEVWRRSRPPTIKQKVVAYKFVLATLAAGVTVMLLLAGTNVTVYWIIAIATFLAAGIFWAPAAAACSRPKDPEAALRRYESINSCPHKLGPGPYRPAGERDPQVPEGPSEPRGEAASIESGEDSALMSDQATFDRLLVCEHPEYRDFYLANDFHLHHACHVMGPDDLETEGGRNLLDRLKKKPEIDVFVVHDATPQGAKFLNEVRSDGRWFGGRAAATLFELGLTGAQLPMFKTMLRPLRLDEMAGVAESVPGLPKGMGADLSVIPAGRLLSLTGASVEERVAFDQNSYAEHTRKKSIAESDDGDRWIGFEFEIGGDSE